MLGLTVMAPILTITPALIACADKPGQPDAARAWTNPIVPQRADPHVWLHTDGYYYLIATVPDYDRIELRRARTLNDLSTAEAKILWTKHETGEMGGPIWAPEIHFIRGKWYIYFSSGTAGKNYESIRVFALENASANPFEGAWLEKGRMQTQWDTFSLDATVFEHSGKLYYVWTQVEPGVQGTNIMMSEMADPVTLTGPEIILSRPDLDWEQQVYWVNEAPSVLIRKGKVFMTYSASATDHNYCLGLLTADENADLMDPKSWSKSQMPVLKSDEGMGQYGPGHNSFTTTPDGKMDILVYHSRNYKHIEGEALANPDRHTRAQVLNWKPDGTPDFGVPVADGPYSF